jgi:hypothetical protein
MSDYARVLLVLAVTLIGDLLVLQAMMSKLKITNELKLGEE